MEKTKDSSRRPRELDILPGSRRSSAPTKADGIPGGSDCLSADDREADTALEAKRPSFLQRLQRHMAAITFAEAGEHLSARDLLEGNQRPPGVLLVIEGHVPDAAAFAHAVQLCKRTGGVLEVLRVLSSIEVRDGRESSSDASRDSSSRLAALPAIAETEGVPCTVATREGAIRDILVDHPKGLKNVAAVILDSPRARASSEKDKVWARFAEAVSRRLSVPLITVMRKDSNTA